jgi:DNA polymerase III subunit delta
MKLTAAQVERFLRQPDPRAATVLVYGPDEGLVRERVERLVATVLDDHHDPFRLSELSADGLKADPGRLLDEARALSLVGGRRVVRLRQASDQVSAACKLLLAQEGPLALVVIDAGELSPASSLRRLIEGAPNAAALPCYHDAGRDLSALIDQILAEHRLDPDPDARQYLLDHLGADRGLTRAELAKLALYLQPAEVPGTAPALYRVTLEEAAAVVGDTAALGLDDLVDAVALGEARQALRCVERLLGEGQSPVRLVRALANHFVRLQGLALEVERGTPAERAIERVRPMIHFRRRDKVRAALRRWPPARCGRALGRLIAAEIACKTTGSPDLLVCRQAALDLCRAAGAVK